MTSDVAWVLHRAGSYSPAMAVERRLRSFKFCSLEIESGMAEKITLNAAWVLQRAGFYSLFKSEHQPKSSDARDLQSPMDGGNAVMMTLV